MFTNLRFCIVIKKIRNFYYLIQQYSIHNRAKRKCKKNWQQTNQRCQVAEAPLHISEVLQEKKRARETNLLLNMAEKKLIL